ncbi:helix-turn-helix domain-containing protein [Streptomyces aureocirculatus]|uniref:helix-turn-helix domain-containing protein n=1 Tax=Streptomyces aureocirculatus TaxID=67275 RepID=UPI0004C4BAE7|nr:helix-turn-helix domain-containing protein [Streptomyces aureocirculatus]
MSSPAPPRRPSPADMPRHPAPPAAKPTTATARTPAPAPARSPQHSGLQTAIAPGKLRDDEVFKSLFRRGLFLSGLPPQARLVAHTLAWYAHHRTGQITPNGQPSVERLARETGLDPNRVRVAIEVLWQRGWLRRRPILSGPRQGRPRMDLVVPAVYLDQVRALRSRHRTGG